MSFTTPAAQFQHLRETLDWARATLAHQPSPVAQSYQQAGARIASAMIHPVFAVTIPLPDSIVIGTTIHHLPDREQVIQVGNLLNRLRRKPGGPSLLHLLDQRVAHSDPVISTSAQVLCYVAGQCILTQHVPPIDSIHTDYVAFDSHGHCMVASIDAADTLITRLSYYLDWMRLAEQLYPAIAADDLFEETYAQLINQITEQGRALATCYTEQLINELRTRWKAGEIARGLTLFIPYLDERQYHMAEYKVVVIPNARIPFRPQFVVSACRVTEREVRQNPNLSQSTRWQLISQLDRVIQAFEAKPDDVQPKSAMPAEKDAAL